MTDYRPVLFHSPTSPGCHRVRRAIRDLGADVDQRSVLLSRRNRVELEQIAGNRRVPCLVVASSVVQEPDEIVKFLELRYGQ